MSSNYIYNNYQYKNYQYKNINIYNNYKINTYTTKNNTDVILSVFSAKQLRDLRAFLIGSSSSIDFSSYSTSQLITLKQLLIQYGINLSTPIVSLPQNNTIAKGIKDSEEEKQYEKEKTKNALLNRFLNDITKQSGSTSFRGWVLPNGNLLSQYNEGNDSNGLRQDHSRLVGIFIKGLELYNNEMFQTISDLYDDYTNHLKIAEAFESFAVERLGWVQVAVCGKKTLAYRGERWQDKLIRDFVVDYNFDTDIIHDGKCYTTEFNDAYEHIEDIIKLGLEERVMRNLN